MSKLVTRLNNHITRTTSFYKEGDSISWMNFRSRVSRYFPYLRDKNPTYYKDTAYYRNVVGILNKVLSERGVYIIMEDYGQRYTIATKEQTRRKVKTKRSRAKYLNDAAIELATGEFKHHSVWSSLTPSEKERVDSRIPRM